MKNLFTFATKELSQDAFLRWLFENYDCAESAELRLACRTLLQDFCELADDEPIVKLTTRAQWHRMDIAVLIHTDRRYINLFIEDKTFSGEHNQLQRYNQAIDQITAKAENEEAASVTKYKVFYQTNRIDGKEHLRIEGLGWAVKSLPDLCRLFEPYRNSDCLLLRQYTEYLFLLAEAFENTQRPEKQDTPLDRIRWKAYFEHVICPRFADRYHVRIVDAGHYNYTMIMFWPRRFSAEQQVPYLELRDRDCLKKEESVTVRLLCYNLYDNTGNISQPEQLQQLLNSISNMQNGVLDSKGIRRDKPKQLGYAKRTGIETDEDLLAFLDECLADYDAAMTHWKEVENK